MDTTENIHGVIVVKPVTPKAKEKSKGCPNGWYV